MISPGPASSDVDPVELLGHEQLDDLGRLDRAVGATPRDRLAAADGPVAHPAEREPSQVRRGVEVGHQRLERMALLVLGSRDVVLQRLEQRLEVVGERVRIRTTSPRPRVGVQDRELDLPFVRVQVQEELVDLVHDLLHARVGTVDLVHDQDHGQVQLERLPQDEARLRQRALARVHQQQHAVDHGQSAFDLTAEVGVPGRVDDVDLQAAVTNGRVLRQDRDALLALQVHGVHDPDVHVLVLAERPGLPEHGVHERGLAVVDVRHDRDVADVVAEGQGHTAFDRGPEDVARRRRSPSVPSAGAATPEGSRGCSRGPNAVDQSVRELLDREVSGIVVGRSEDRQPKRIEVQDELPELACAGVRSPRGRRPLA